MFSIMYLFVVPFYWDHMEMEPWSHLEVGEVVAGINSLCENGFSAESMYGVYEIAVALCSAVEIRQWKGNRNWQISEKSCCGQIFSHLYFNKATLKRPLCLHCGFNKAHLLPCFALRGQALTSVQSSSRLAKIVRVTKVPVGLGDLRNRVWFGKVSSQILRSFWHIRCWVIECLKGSKEPLKI